MSNDAESMPTAPQTPEDRGAGGDGQPRGRCSDLEAKLKALRDGWTKSGKTIDVLRTRALEAHAQRWKTIAKLKLKSVTPIYGGGTTPGQVDWLVPLRPRAIKNATRHWWWLLNRHQYAGRAGDLYKKMVAIWGGPSEEDADLSARVRVIVDLPLPHEVEKHRFTYLPYKESRSGTATPDTENSWLYALFGAKGKLRGRPIWQSFDASRECIADDPAQGRWRLKQHQRIFDERPADLLAPGLELGLTIETRDPSNEDSVLEALRAWLTIGGIGARSSRGLGHLEILSAEGETWNNKPLSKSVEDIESRLGIRDSGGNSWIGASCGSPIEAWQKALREYRDFRQLRLPKELRSDGKRTPGRSCWPKADTVRALTRSTLNGYPHDIHHKAVPHFESGRDTRTAPNVSWPVPEMYFGAPMVVQFANAAELREPWAVRFLPATSGGRDEVLVFERFPSPVLTLPWFDDRARKWRPRIVALPYASDLKSLGVFVRNEKDDERNAFHFHKAWEGEAAFIPPDIWWPLASQRAVWDETPYKEPYKKAKQLVASGDADPIKTLFNFLHRRKGLP
jgi:CRISPR/Cas system CMR-associated protein Cmr1 (group 7 of RAMP superfamily)